MHITISGNLGSGKSTVAKVLSKKLGYEIYSTGSIQRSAAENMGITTLELNSRMMTDPALDHVIDDTVTRVSLERDNLIFDSRMAWHFARNAFRVFITVNPTVAAQRVLDDQRRGAVETYASVEEAEAALAKRSGLERERFLDIYKLDYYDMNNYDLVLDSTGSTPDAIADIIISEYQKKANT